MNKVILTTLFAIMIVVAMLFETTIIAVPLVYLIGAFFLIFLRRVRIYILVFILAIFTDSLRVTDFGLTPLFLLALCGIIFIYEKYSGSDDKLISSLIISASAVIYAHYLAYSVNLTLFFLVMAGIVWYGFYRLQQKGVLPI